MDSYVSLIEDRYFFKNTANTFKIPVTKSGIAHCSVSLFLAYCSKLQPSAIQYIGIEQVLVWKPQEEGIKYLTFEILPTAHALEYLTIGLKNFLRCKPYLRSQAIVAIGNPECANYPFLFGGYTKLTKSTMNNTITLEGDIYTSSYSFYLPNDASLGDIRTVDGRESLPYVYKSIIKDNNTWLALIQIMNSEPIEDGSIEINVVLL